MMTCFVMALVLGWNSLDLHHVAKGVCTPENGIAVVLRGA